MEKEKTKIIKVDVRESFINLVVEYNNEIYEGILLKKGQIMNNEKSMD